MSVSGIAGGLSDVCAAERLRVMSDAMFERSIVLGADTADWLRSEVERGIASGSIFDACVARGISARLARMDGLAAVGAEWLRSLSPEQLRSVEFQVIFSADALIDDLDGVESCVAQDDPSAAQSALSWLHRRDDLESVAHLFERAGLESARDVRAALYNVDHVALMRQAVWLMLPVFDDDRLLEVSWQEPEAWWAELVW